MSLTFGAAATDWAQYTGGPSGLADNSSTLVTCWVYPTTLTAGRALWGMGTQPGIAALIHTTTSEIDVRSNNGTTDGIWRTSGLGLALNQWQFLAVFCATENTTVPGQVRVWRGTEWEPPVAATVTNPTVRSGNYAGSATRTIGNSVNAGSLAFQGDIAGFSCLVTDAVGVNNGLVTATSGTLSADQEELLYRRWVWPLWNGDPKRSAMRTVALSGNFELSYAPLDVSNQAMLYTAATVFGTNRSSLSVSGATFSQNTPSRLPPPDWVLRMLKPQGRR